MAKVYKRLGEPDGMTDYLLWRSDRREGIRLNDVTISVDQLADISLKMGISEG